MGRYDMRGLAMYGDDGLGAWMDAEMLKQSLMAGGTGALGILVTSKVLSYLPDDMVADPVNNSRIKSLIAAAVGVFGGRMIYEYNRDAGMGFVGAVSGSALASLIASWAPDMLSTNLSGGLADADLAALEATVATNSPAYRPGLSAPDVSMQPLARLGLGATETSSEELMAYSAMMDQSAPPPSF